MTLGTPYPIFIFLKNNSINLVPVPSRTVNCKSITNYQGISSGVTDANGRTSIEMEYISNNGDLCQIYDGTFVYEFILNASGLPARFYLYQNSSTVGDISQVPMNYGNELYLTADNYIGKDINIKTMSC